MCWTDRKGSMLSGYGGGVAFSLGHVEFDVVNSVDYCLNIKA